MFTLTDIIIAALTSISVSVGSTLAIMNFINSRKYKTDNYKRLKQNHRLRLDFTDRLNGVYQPTVDNTKQPPKAIKTLLNLSLPIRRETLLT